jgi:hypothetical protein
VIDVVRLELHRVRAVQSDRLAVVVVAAEQLRAGRIEVGLTLFRNIALSAAKSAAIGSSISGAPLTHATVTPANVWRRPGMSRQSTLRAAVSTEPLSTEPLSAASISSWQIGKPPVKRSGAVQLTSMSSDSSVVPSRSGNTVVNDKLTRSPGAGVARSSSPTTEIFVPRTRMRSISVALGRSSAHAVKSAGGTSSAMRRSAFISRLAGRGSG